MEYKAISSYKPLKNPEKWLKCPNCKLKPLIWTFDNGRHTACGCGKNEYNHFSIRAESIMSVMQNSYNGTSLAKYDQDELRKNWNHWVKTGEELFEYQKYNCGFESIMRW